MMEAAQNLQFERAAELRDKIKQLEERINSRRYTDTLKNVWRMDGRQRLSFWNRGLRKK